MNRTTLQETEWVKIHNILAHQLTVQLAQITPEASIVEDLSADSLDIMEISMAVEEQFNITLPDECLDRINTVADLCEEVALILEQKK